MNQPRPIIAITADLIDRNGRPTAISALTYSHAIARAGGIPVVLAPTDVPAVELIARFDGFILSGGDDPRTEPFGQPTHQAATPVLPDRQRFETDLLNTLLEHRPEAPVLGICLGMQMQALVAGGSLDQYLPDTHAEHARHWSGQHPIVPEGGSPLPAGTVLSHHRQAVCDPGSLRVLGRSDDGLIEVIGDPGRPFYLGVQWHPERTTDAALGAGLFDRLIAACVGSPLQIA